MDLLEPVRVSNHCSEIYKLPVYCKYACSDFYTQMQELLPSTRESLKVRTRKNSGRANPSIVTDRETEAQSQGVTCLKSYLG